MWDIKVDRCVRLSREMFYDIGLLFFRDGVDIMDYFIWDYRLYLSCTF